MVDEEVDEAVTDEDPTSTMCPNLLKNKPVGMGSVADGNEDPLPMSRLMNGQGISFGSTDEVPIPDTLVGQVIGQEDAAIVIRKAAEQRRHMLMIGDGYRKEHAGQGND